MSQINGVNFNEAKSSYDCTVEEMTNPDGLFLKSSSGTYAFMYQVTPVCVKHAWEKMYWILKDNNCIRQPDDDRSFFASYVTDELIDYENIAKSCKIGDSEVAKIWDLSNGWSIAYNITTKYAMVSMYKR